MERGRLGVQHFRLSTRVGTASAKVMPCRHGGGAAGCYGAWPLAAWLSPREQDHARATRPPRGYLESGIGSAGRRRRGAMVGGRERSPRPGAIRRGAALGRGAPWQLRRPLALRHSCPESFPTDEPHPCLSEPTAIPSPKRRVRSGRPALLARRGDPDHSRLEHAVRPHRAAGRDAAAFLHLVRAHWDRMRDGRARRHVDRDELVRQV